MALPQLLKVPRPKTNLLKLARDMGELTTILSPLTFFVQTYGCQMNKHDSERITGLLESFGATAVSALEDADIAIFMTCCVREAADVRLMGQVNTIKNVALPKGSQLDHRIVAIGGCIGQRDGAKLLHELPHIDVVFGTHNIGMLPTLLADAITTHKQQAVVLEEAESFPTDLPTERAHSWAAWLPITIGCNNFCTYCVVPYVRGREKSRPLEDIVQEARSYVSQGVKEITLLGQNVNSYGRDLYGAPQFARLLSAVADTGIERLRFATSHPKDITDDVIDMFGAGAPLMPALHLPFQSGSNRILELMNRRYTAEHYREIIQKLRAARPDIALSTDIIVGFPGETEDDFQQTYDLVKEVGYHQVFTFIYSKRAGTPAARMEDNTPREVIQERFDRLVALVEEGAYQANQADAGSVVDVLIEGTSKRDPHILAGKSPKNQTVHAPVPAHMSVSKLVGTIVPVHIDVAKTWYLAGEIVGTSKGTDTQ